jgi:hypothetical protein
MQLLQLQRVGPMYRTLLWFGLALVLLAWSLHGYFAFTKFPYDDIQSSTGSVFRMKDFLQRG